MKLEKMETNCVQENVCMNENHLIRFANGTLRMCKAGEGRLLEQELYTAHRGVLDATQTELKCQLQTGSCNCPISKELYLQLQSLLSSNSDKEIFNSFVSYICAAQGLSNYAENTQQMERMKQLHQMIKSGTKCSRTTPNSGTHRVQLPVSKSFPLLENWINDPTCDKHQLMHHLLEWCLIRDEMLLSQWNYRKEFGRISCKYLLLLIENGISNCNMEKTLSWYGLGCKFECCNSREKFLAILRNESSSYVVDLLTGLMQQSGEKFLDALLLIEDINLQENNQLVTFVKPILESLPSDTFRNGVFNYANVTNLDEYYTKVIGKCLTLFNGALCFELGVLQAKHFTVRHDSTLESQLLKLSSDGFFVRAVWNSYWQTIRSVNSVNSGIFYYEVFLIDFEQSLRLPPFKIGWANAKHEPMRHFNSIGEDENSIGLYANKLYQCDKFYDIENEIPGPKAGDVIGCLIDFHKYQFKFYYNGEMIRPKKKFFIEPKIHFSDKIPYYAAVSIENGAYCYFNFGQTEFKFAPRDVDLSSQLRKPVLLTE